MGLVRHSRSVDEADPVRGRGRDSVVRAGDQHVILKPYPYREDEGLRRRVAGSRCRSIGMSYRTASAQIGEAFERQRRPTRKNEVSLGVP